MPPEPCLDLAFLIMSFCAVFFNILTVIYYRKARNYKKQLDECRSYLNNTSTSFTKPANSTPEATIANNQSRGEKTF